MKLTATVILVIAITGLMGCKSADQQIPQIANDFCGCFSEMEAKMSETTKSIISKAAMSNDPQKTLQDELEALPEDKKMAAATEMVALGDLQDKTSKVGKCTDDVAKKYDKATTFNEKKFLEKLIQELDTKTKCSTTADLMRIGVKSKESK